MGVTSRWKALAVVGVLLVGLAAVVAWLVWDGDDGDDRDDGEERDGSAGAPAVTGPLEVSPDRLSPLDPFTVTMTDGRRVHGDFSLAVWDGVGWTYQYQLLGSASGVDDGAQRWRTWSERTMALPDLQLGGDEPIHLVVPSHIISGDYRLCDEYSAPPICTGLTVVD